MFLGIDCGTQGTKALAVDAAGTVFGRGYAAHRLLQTSNGAREQEPVWWVEAMCSAARQALAAENLGGKIRALAVSGQQHGLVVLDENNEVIRPAKLWNDTETAFANAELIDRLGGESMCLQRFGIVPRTGYTASKLLWLSHHEPENFERIRHILLPHEYLNFWLTGKFHAEFGDASGTAFFDVRNRTWTRDVLDAIDGGKGHLSKAVASFVAPDAIVGNVTQNAGDHLRISTDCVVAAGGGDNMMGAIGTGNVREGVVTLSLGTSSTVYSFKNQPTIPASLDVAPFCSSSGGWLPLVCTMNATNVVTTAVEMLGKTVSAIDEALEATPPGADGLVFLPFLNGERTPDLPGARGSLHGMSATNFTPSNFIRAAVEGVSFGILNGLDLILDGRRAEVIQLIGGGSRSAGWRQLLADASGAEIQVPAEEEAGCLGAAIQAMVAFSKLTNAPRGFEEVVKEVVHTDERTACRPCQELLVPYEQARANYQYYLNAYLATYENHPLSSNQVVS